MNELGLGVTFQGTDLASGIIQRVGKGLLDTVGAASAAGKAIKSYFKDFSIGMGLLGVGAAGLAMLAPATREASEFGKAIALVATETDLAVFSQFQMMEAAHDLGNTFGRLPKDEAVAMYEAVGMGANTAAKATALMTASNRLAVAGNADLKTTIDALGGAMRAYGAAFTDSNASAYADTMFVGMTSGKTTVQELAGSLGRVTSMASSLGLSFDETVAAISAMTSTGIEANMAVTGLHGAFANLLHPEAHATAEAARLGIKFDSVTLKTKGLKGMLDSIMDAKGFKGVETMKKLFPSVEGFNAIMQITAGNMGGFKDALGAMKDKAGAAGKGFMIMAETASFQEDRLKSLKSTALIVIGQALEPMAVGALKFTNAILNGFNSLSPPVRDFMIRAFAMTATLLTVVGGAIATKAALGILMVGMSALGVTFTGVLATIAPVLVGLGLVAVAFYAFRQAYDENIGGFGTFIDLVYAKVRLGVLALGQLFSDGAFSGAVLEELDKSDGTVEHFVIRVWGFAQRIVAFFGGVADGFEKAVEEMKPSLQEFATSLEAFGVSFESMYKAIDPHDAASSFDGFKQSGVSLGATMGKVAEAIVKGMTAVVDLATAVKPLVSGLADLIGNLGGLKTVVYAVEVALVAMAARGIAAVVVASAELGVAAANTVVRMALMATSMDIGAAVSAGVAGLRAFTVASATALGPVGALAAALVALYLAFDQAKKLWKELGDSGMGDMWAKFKNDIGVDSDDYYGRTRLGHLSGADDPDAWAAHERALAAQHLPGPTMASLSESAVASVAPAGSRASQGAAYLPVPAPASAAAAGGMADALRAAAGAGVDPEAIGMAFSSALSSNPLQVSPGKTVMTLNEQVIGETVTEWQRSNGVSSEVPMSPAH